MCVQCVSQLSSVCQSKSCLVTPVQATLLHSMCLEGVTEISLTVIWGQGACYHRWPRFLSFFSWFACITCVSQGSRVCILCVSQKQKVCIPCQCGYGLSPGLARPAGVQRDSPFLMHRPARAHGAHCTRTARCARPAPQCTVRSAPSRTTSEPAVCEGLCTVLWRAKGQNAAQC